MTTCGKQNALIHFKHLKKKFLVNLKEFIDGNLISTAMLLPCFASLGAVVLSKRAQCTHKAPKIFK